MSSVIYALALHFRFRVFGSCKLCLIYSNLVFPLQYFFSDCTNTVSCINIVIYSLTLRFPCFFPSKLFSALIFLLIFIGFLNMVSFLLYKYCHLFLNFMIFFASYLVLVKLYTYLYTYFSLIFYYLFFLAALTRCPFLFYQY